MFQFKYGPVFQKSQKNEKSNENTIKRVRDHITKPKDPTSQANKKSPTSPSPHKY